MKIFKTLILSLFVLNSYSQQKAKTIVAGSNPARPKLVVGLVVDQMRWDYLYRYTSRYGEGGFKRLLKEGFSCENAHIGYATTQTACGHASIYTGSVPAINGITANNWIEQNSGYDMYCTEDTTVNTVGSTSDAGKMSPKNLLSSTLGDELKLATNFRSKVIGIALKDRGGILPAGHSANAAYWFDDLTGSWISSTYYMKDLPEWVQKFNNQKPIDKYLTQDWNTLYSLNTYLQSSPDDTKYEGTYPGEEKPIFPHEMGLKKSNNYAWFRLTPFANTLTLDFAKATIKEEKLGADDITDLLAVSLSSTDYIGHQFGPNSIEIEDTYLRLDKDLEVFLTYLDNTVGKGNYTFFLSADHGAAHNPNFLIDNKINAGYFNTKNISKQLNELLLNKYQAKGLIRAITNYQVNFNYQAIEASKIDIEDLKKDCINFLKKQEGVSFVVDLANVNEGAVPAKLREKIINAYHFKRSGELQIVLDPAWFQGYGITGTSHGVWNPYDTHIPMVFMGWGIKQGISNRTVSMSDIAPTLSALLRIQEPNGNIGDVVTEALK
jgi:predicted AlkP superfamily pyrophosphatase or phosphodiesterase